MEIHSPCVVSLTWKLADAQNRPLDELTEPVEFFYGGDDLLAKVEEALEGHERGAELHLQLEPADAFGDYRPELVCFEERKLFAEPVEVGMAYEGLPKGHATPDMPPETVYIVTEVYPTHIVLDGNHPLAGMALRLHITVRDVREATDGELEAKSVGESTITVLGSAPGKPGRQTMH
ncbi:MAG: peptidylprolyl isomerase [Rubrivivax sp.]|nr:peptidylprolyl isomerase [Rubrivivax sp.]